MNSLIIIIIRGTVATIIFQHYWEIPNLPSLFIGIYVLGFGMVVGFIDYIVSAYLSDFFQI